MSTGNTCSNCETLRQRMKELEGRTGIAYKEGYESGSKDERAISDKLEKALSELLRMYERKVDSQTAKVQARDALAELTAMRKGETE